MNKRLVVSWIALLAALTALSAVPGCAERRAEGGSCVFNDDCSDPLICAGSFCRAQCRTDRDCPAGWLCHQADAPGKQVCLPPPAPVLCVADEHCPTAAMCTAAHQCRWRCARDADCASRRAALTCGAARVCNQHILVVEFQITAGDGGAPPVDASMPGDVVTPDDTPVADAPVSDVPVADVPAADAPVSDVPVVDAPVADVPAVDTPVVDAPAPVDTTPRCGRDFQCDDGVFCNGAEVCAPTDPAADARGCAPPLAPRCMSGQRCDERMGRCLTMCEIDGDADDDGFDAVMCGGPDCDDARASVHPGAPELCNGRDDDCDGMTDEAGAALCSLAFATAACREGACGVATCSPGYGDCDGVGSNGCESPLSADALNCGACGRICAIAANAMTMGCRAGGCVVATCRAGFADCDGMAANGCELDARADVTNCGRCGNRCSTRPSATATCVDGACAIACAAGRGDCDGDAVNGCETDLQNDRAHCGACGSRCPVASDGCVSGSCVAQPFASDGSEGAFAPTAGDAGVATVRLAPGIHQFTTVNVPEGVTVVTSGDGVLEIRASGDVVIVGVVDVSGGRGGNALAAEGAGCGGNGGGGATGNVTAPGANGVAGMCARPGGGGTGSAGGNGSMTGSNCGLGGAFGGASGGLGGTGGGGGGVSGGVGANAIYAGAGGAGAMVAGFGSGSTGFGEGGDATNMSIAAVYRGGGGSCGTTAVTAGGGGSIGYRAALDLTVSDPLTFRAGSGGGGGSTTVASCVNGGGGGGGGGGAVRIASPTRITIRGAVYARGGDGGNGAGGSAGGAGSGGLVYLSAPSIEVTSGVVSAAGGRGGGVNCVGGNGGLGRVRLSVLPALCRLSGTFTPPLPTGGCVPAATPAANTTYIGTYPN